MLKRNLMKEVLKIQLLYNPCMVNFVHLHLEFRGQNLSCHINEARETNIYKKILKKRLSLTLCQSNQMFPPHLYCRQTERIRQMYRQRENQTETERESDGQRQTDNQTDRQTDIQRKSDRLTDRG